MSASRARALTSAAAAAVVILSGCSASGAGEGMSGMDHGPSSSPSRSSAAVEFNEADIAFARNMIPHHEGAIDMSDVILAKDGIDQRVVDLATQIKEAQGPEIEQLRQWLMEWGAEEMSGMHHDMEGMEMGMSDLENGTGVDAARMFLEEMKVHHQGAVTMAQTEVDMGSNPDAIEMAQAIIATQTEEIETIERILASL